RGHGSVFVEPLFVIGRFVHATSLLASWRDRSRALRCRNGARGCSSGTARRTGALAKRLRLERDRRWTARCLAISLHSQTEEKGAVLAGCDHGGIAFVRRLLPFRPRK